MSDAAQALDLVRRLQRELVGRLEALAGRAGDAATLAGVSWQRDGGRHGGGERFVAALTPTFNRVAVNVSHVFYDDEPAKRLASATALSSIIHPRNPHAPSLHMHISWTEMKSGEGGWRLMADLNPSIANPDDERAFRDVLRGLAPDLYDGASAQGDKYFWIPALERHRGAAHFYLEGFASADAAADLTLAAAFGEGVSTCYAAIVSRALAANPQPTATAARAQLEYHTAYLLQVLTLDRGTTSGLLVHDQNDVGILGSLPAFVDRELLASWVSRMPNPQDKLLASIAAALPDEQPSPVTDDRRAILAAIVRRHYQENPSALELQASGDRIPQTAGNHAD